MRITYRPNVDARCIRLVDGPQQCRVLRLHDEVSHNIGAGETLVGIEVLDTREVLGAGAAPEVILEDLKAS